MPSFDLSDAASSSKALLDAARELSARDGTSIRWVELGSGAPLIVSPALATPLVSWLPALSVLAAGFRVVFVLPRGGCEGPIPGDQYALSVQHRADDLADLIGFFRFTEYFVVAHSSGVAPVVLSWKQAHRLPSGACLVSSRYAAGRPVGAEELLKRARRDAGFLTVVRSVAVGYAPPSASEVMREQLQDFERLAALLRAFESSRAFRYAEPMHSGIPITFVMGERDPDEVRATTMHACAQLAPESATLVDVRDAGHFFLQEDGPEAAKLITRSLVSPPRRLLDEPNPS